MGVFDGLAHVHEVPIYTQHSNEPCPPRYTDSKILQAGGGVLCQRIRHVAGSTPLVC